MHEYTVQTGQHTSTVELCETCGQHLHQELNAQVTRASKRSTDSAYCEWCGKAATFENSGGELCD